LGLDEGFDEGVGGLRVQGEGVAQRLQLGALLEEVLFEAVAAGVEVLLDGVERRLEHGALLWRQVLFQLLQNHPKSDKKFTLGLEIRTMTPLSAFLTSCLPAMWFLKRRDMSSILALAARFLALSFKFFSIIYAMNKIPGQKPGRFNTCSNFSCFSAKFIGFKNIKPILDPSFCKSDLIKYSILSSNSFGIHKICIGNSQF